MITYYDLTDDELLQMIEEKEVPAAILSKAKNIMVILTQSWCPDWHTLQNDLKMQEKGDDEVLVCIGIYDKSVHFDRFREVKENVWQNGLIPYIRCYKEGVFMKDYNLMPFKRMVKSFN